MATSAFSLSKWSLCCWKATCASSKRAAFASVRAACTSKSKSERYASYSTLAVSYCRIVNRVSSIVLLQSVFKVETKKLIAFWRVSPFFVIFRCDSALYVNSSWSSGDFWASSANDSPSACFEKRKIVGNVLRLGNEFKLPEFAPYDKND